MSKEREVNKYELHPDVKSLLEDHPAFCHCHKEPCTAKWRKAHRWEEKQCQHDKDWWHRLSETSPRFPALNLQWTYIVHVGGNFYKIGTTWNIAQRLRAFQMSNPFITGIESIVAAIPHGRSYEQALHKFCREKEWNYDGKSSELFEISPEEIAILLDHIADREVRTRRAEVNKINRIRKADRPKAMRTYLNEGVVDFRKRKKINAPALSRSELSWLIDSGANKLLERDRDKGKGNE